MRTPAANDFVRNAFLVPCPVAPSICWYLMQLWLRQVGWGEAEKKRVLCLLDVAEITVVHLKQKVPWSWEPARGLWKWETFIVLSSSSFQFLQWKQFHFIRDTFPSHCPTSPPPTLLLMIIFKAEHLVGFRVGERGKKPKPCSWGSDGLWQQTEPIPAGWNAVTHLINFLVASVRYRRKGMGLEHPLGAQSPLIEPRWELREGKQTWFEPCTFLERQMEGK